MFVLQAAAGGVQQQGYLWLLLCWVLSCPVISQQGMLAVAATC
jgi:hypothetical protein